MCRCIRASVAEIRRVEHPYSAKMMLSATGVPEVVEARCTGLKIASMLDQSSQYCVKLSSLLADS